MAVLSDFISSERERFTEADNNKFAMCFAQISRYYAFLQVILKRYEAASRQLFENTKAMQASLLAGTHSFTDEQMKLHEEGVRLMLLVHLEIESFYLFAKICLDRIAHALEFYFGPVRGRSLDSHDDLVKDFLLYAEAKTLVLPTDFMKVAEALKKDISDYRDYEIAHEKSPRRMSATVFDAEGRMRIAGTSIYPTDKDQQVESKVLHDLAGDLDIYLKLLIEVVKSNRDKTRLARTMETNGEV